MEIKGEVEWALLGDGEVIRLEAEVNDLFKASNDCLYNRQLEWLGWSLQRNRPLIRPCAVLRIMTEDEYYDMVYREWEQHDNIT